MNGKPISVSFPAVFSQPLLKAVLNILTRLLGKSPGLGKTCGIQIAIYHVMKIIRLTELCLWLLLTPHLGHHFSLRKYEITKVFLEQIFYPEARRARAVCFILSFLSPTHFLFYSREISELFVISAFRRFHCPSCSMDYQ